MNGVTFSVAYSKRRMALAARVVPRQEEINDIFHLVLAHDFPLLDLRSVQHGCPHALGIVHVEGGRHRNGVGAKIS